MKKQSRVLALVVLAVMAVAFCSACSTPGMIRADSIDDATRIVVDRHDEYVRKDMTMSDADKATALRTSELLMRLIEEAMTSQVEGE